MSWRFHLTTTTSSRSFIILIIFECFFSFRQQDGLSDWLGNLSLPLKLLKFPRENKRTLFFVLFCGEILRIGFINGRKGSASYIIEWWASTEILPMCYAVCKENSSCDMPQRRIIAVSIWQSKTHTARKVRATFWTHRNCRKRSLGAALCPFATIYGTDQSTHRWDTNRPAYKKSIWNKNDSIAQRTTTNKNREKKCLPINNKNNREMEKCGNTNINRESGNSSSASRYGRGLL